MGLFLQNVDNADEAHKACAGAAGISFFIAIVTGVVVFLQQSGKINILPGIGNAAYIDVGLFVLIGLGLSFHSRLAAVGGLILYVGERGYMMFQHGFNPGQVVFMVIIGIAFINGIRGAFAWHNYKGEAVTDAASQAAAQDKLLRATENKGGVFGGVLKFIFAFLFLVAAGAASFYLIKNKDSVNVLDWVKEQTSVLVKKTSKTVTKVKKRTSQPLVAPAGPTIKLKLKSGRNFEGVLIKKNGEGYWVFIDGMGEVFFSMKEIAEVA